MINGNALEAGTFQFPFAETGRKELAAWELAVLLEGIDLSQGKRRKRYSLPAEVTGNVASVRLHFFHATKVRNAASGRLERFDVPEMPVRPTLIVDVPKRRPISSSATPNCAQTCRADVTPTSRRCVPSSSRLTAPGGVHWPKS